MKIKFFIAAISLMIMSAGSTFAQQRVGQQRGGQPMSTGEIAKNRTERLKQVVGLSDKQEKAVYAIYEKSAKDIQKSRQSGNREAWQAIQAKTEKDVHAQLTPDQLKKWTESNANVGPNRRPGNMPNNTAVNKRMMNNYKNASINSNYRYQDKCKCNCKCDCHKNKMHKKSPKKKYNKRVHHRR